MPLILHLFKKDLRRSCLLLAFWALLIAVHYGLMASSLRPGDALAHMTYTVITNVAPFLEAVVLAVLVALLVQEESPAGTTGFWLTRPMSRSAVLQTKAIFALLILALPVLAEVIVFRAGGVTRRDLALAVPEIILTQLQVMLAAAVLAALTTNFARFAIAGAVCWVGQYLITLGTDWLPAYLGRDQFITIKTPVTLLHSRLIAHDALIAAGLGAIFIYQYATRRTARAWAMAVAVDLAAMAATNFWSWDFFSPLPTPSATITLDRSAIKMTLQDSAAQDISGYRNSGQPRKNIAGELRITGLPTGYAALPKEARPRLTGPDGRAIPAQSPTYSYYIFTPDSNLFEFSLGKAYVYGSPWMTSQTPTGLATVDGDTYRKYAQQRLKLSDEIDFDVARYVVIARIPVTKGSEVKHGSEHEFITDVLRTGEDVDLIFHRRYLNLLFGREVNGRTGNQYLLYLDFSPGNRTYVLFNHRTKEVIRAQMNGVHELTNQRPDGRLVEETWQIAFGPDNYTLTPDLNAAWLADAELIELELKPAAAFTHELTADNFTLEGPNRPSTPPPPDPPTNPEWLTRFVLPEPATKEQMKQYVDDLVAAIQYWHAQAHWELPVAMLAKVGTGNTDVLLGALDHARPANLGFPLLQATIRIAGPNDKAAVLRALAANHDLVSLVVKFNWESDCRGTLLTELRDPKNDALPRDWIVAVTALRDPALYPDLKAYLVRAHNRQAAYNAIRKLPGIDLEGTIAAAWKRAQTGSRSDLIDAAAMAIDVGYPDALAALIGVLREDDVGQPQQLTRAQTLVRRYTPAKGDAAALVAWYDTNKAALVFDAIRRKFLPPPTQ